MIIMVVMDYLCVFTFLWCYDMTVIIWRLRCWWWYIIIISSSSLFV